jgi:hypothetical protein
MRRTLLACWIASTHACGGIAVVDGELCLHWTEAGPIAVEAPPAELACEVASDVEARYAAAGLEVPSEPKGDVHWVEYVCIAAPDDGPCPAPRIAEVLASSCLGESSSGCNPVGGLCIGTFVWSLCGPDPSALGACCYYANMVTWGYISAFGSE